MSKQSTKLRKLVSLVLAAIVAVSCFSVSAAAAEKTSVSVGSQAADTDDSAGTPEPACPCYTYFTNSQYWENVYAYAWDADGNSLLGDWPGTLMEQFEPNDYGEPIFGLYIPYEAVGFIFNSGFDGEQTCDIENTSAEGYYITGIRDRDGHLVAYPWNYTPTPEYFYGDVDLDGNVTISDATKISFYLAQFEDSKLGYMQQALADVDGNGTVSIADATEIQFWLAELKNDSKTNQRCVVNDKNNNSGYNFKLYDNMNWGTIYAYAWDEDGNALLGDLPGALLPEPDHNDLGEAVFTVNLPSNAAGVFFSNGNKQTADCTVFLTGTECLMFYEIDDNTGSYYVDRPDCPVPPIPDPDQVKTIYFNDNQNWGSARIYAWDADGSPLLGEWPGTAMTYEGVNDFGEPYYTAEIPKDAVGIVFNSGADGDQTEDLSPTPNAEYLSTGQRNENGHLIVFANLKSMDNIL